MPPILLGLSFRNLMYIVFIVQGTIFHSESWSNNDLPRYQLLVGLLFAMMEAPHAWCMLMHKFVAVPIDHW